MKFIKYIGHPVLLMSLYLLLLIESEHFGGFYLLYILMALPTGAPFAVISLLGLICVFIGYKIYREQFHVLKPTLYLLGWFTMLVGLLLFFSHRDRLATFELSIPTTTFVLFGICSVCFFIYVISLFVKKRDRLSNDFNVTT
jgi:xanthosine utilization system XapX-like protein